MIQGRRDNTAKLSRSHEVEASPSGLVNVRGGKWTTYRKMAEDTLHFIAKRSPLDFILWRPAAPGEPSWESRWGSGRPGWHVECSAIALREVGPTIDLHGGGIDLLYPHHESVRVQCEAATGQPLARHWLHHSMVHFDGRKMSKSTGNLIFVHHLRERFDPAAIRLALSIHHYRRPWNWTDDLLDEAAERRRPGVHRRVLA